MALVATHLDTGANTQALNAYNTASIAPAAERLLVVAVGGTRADARIPEVSGLGLTWTQHNGGATLIGTINYSFYMFTAWTGAIAPAAGPITITWTGTTMTSCQWSVSEWSGVDNAAGPIVQSAFAQDAAGFLAPSLTLAAFASPTNGTWGGIQTNNNTETITAGAGFTLFGQAGNSGPNAKIASEGRIDADTTVDFGGVATTTPWGMVGAEIREATGAASTNHIVGDSAAGTDAVAVEAAATGIETAAGTDVVAVEAASVLTDLAAGTDALVVGRVLLDPVAGADTVATTAASTVADSGAGTDTTSAVTALTVVDTVAGADAVVAEVLALVTDTAVGMDAASVTVASTVADPATGSDAVEVVAALAVTDTGAGADTVTVAAAPTAANEVGTGVDTVSVAVSLAVADAGSGDDTAALTVAVTIGDSGAGVDATGLVLLVADAMNGVDAVVATGVLVAAAVVSFEGGTGRSVFHEGAAGRVASREGAPAHTPIIEA